MAQVYLSSTSKDLLDARAAATWAIQRLQHQPVGMEMYGADNRPTVTRCEADVRGADVYVVLLGWRYGSLGDAARGLSFTELEYLAARDSGKPVLAYELCPEADWQGTARTWTVDPDLTALERFRASLHAAHEACKVRSLEDLKQHLLADLPRHVAAAPERLDLLPYLCDRDDQRKGLRDRLRPTKGDPRWKPAVAVVHGPSVQAVDMFLRCVLDAWLPTAFRGRQGLGCRHLALAWTRPCPQDPAEDLLGQLQEKDGLQDVTDAAEVFRRIQTWRQPVLVDLPVSHDFWTGPDAGRLESFARFWTQDAPSLPAPLLALAWVQYRPAAGWWWQRRRVEAAAARIREALGALTAANPDVVVLPELCDVPYEDVSRWRTGDEFRALAPGVDVDPQKVDRLFGSARALPMRPLGEGLRGAFVRRARGVEVRR
jgi:hypothetical protein